MASKRGTRMASVVALLLTSWVSKCSSYPLIAEIPEEEDKCFRFNIPEDDDAHMVFLAMPYTVSDALEEWYVNEINQLIKARKTTGPAEKLPKKLLNSVPPELQKEIDSFYSDSGFDERQPAGVRLNVEKPRRPSLRTQEFKWFSPIILNHVVKTHGDKDFDSGYAICFQNRNDEHEALIIFDIVLVSDNDDLDEQPQDAASILKKEHLTPLEENLEESIDAAQSVLNEMRYLEKRESRMRQTADSINSKVRLFSWLSVAILLGVTYFQVTYLKTYFKKKKLM